MNAPHDTETGQPGPYGPEPGESGPRVTRDEVRDLARLRRSRTDRKVSGVAGGIARHLDIDPLLVRVAFVILTFFGGGGLLLYGVAWVLVPEEDTGDTVIRTDDGVRTAALVIAGVLAVASVIGDSIGGIDFPWPLMLVGLVLLVVFGSKQAKENRAGGADSLVPPPPPGTEGPTYEGYRPWQPPHPPRPVDPRRRGPLLFPFTLALTVLALGVVGTVDLAGADVVPSAYPATVLGVVGLMLVVGAFFGRAGGLILVGLVAALATALTSVVGDDDIGEIRETPRSAAALDAAYRLGVGDMVIDLTDIPAAQLTALDERRLELDNRVGHIRVIVPDTGLDVDVDAQIIAGEVVLFDNGKSDTSEKASHDGGDDTPTLTIEADMFLGQIEVLTEEQAA